eukprot:1159279-Pelagomonas_calceolata.AAC.14
MLPLGTAQGTDLTDEELVDHISEATTMSKGIDEYDGELRLWSGLVLFIHQLWDGRVLKEQCISQERMGAFLIRRSLSAMHAARGSPCKACAIFPLVYVSSKECAHVIAKKWVALCVKMSALQSSY